MNNHAKVNFVYSYLCPGEKSIT